MQDPESQPPPVTLSQISTASQEQNSPSSPFPSVSSLSASSPATISSTLSKGSSNSSMTNAMSRMEVDDGGVIPTMNIGHNLVAMPAERQDKAPDEAARVGVDSALVSHGASDFRTPEPDGQPRLRTHTRQSASARSTKTLRKRPNRRTSFVFPSSPDPTMNRVAGGEQGNLVSDEGSDESSHTSESETSKMSPSNKRSKPDGGHDTSRSRKCSKI